MTHSRSFTGRSGPQCILVIDDDNAVRNSIKLFLEDFNYLVLDAENGSTGLELFAQHHPDLILLDLRMPEMSGLDFLRQIRQKASEVPVIVISGTGRMDDAIEAMRRGAVDFLLKPIDDLQVLLHSVENVFEKTRLKQENRDYREHLEEIISHRTATLERTYRQLRETNQTLEALFDAAPLAILAIDSEERITLWNHAAEQIFGWSAQEVIGKPYPLVPPAKEAESEQMSLTASRDKSYQSVELGRRHKDGHLVEVSLSTAPLHDKDRNNGGLIIMMEDISERKRLQNETERNSRLASLGELAAGVAHEINNPNGLILLNLPTIRDFVLDSIKLLQGHNCEQKLGGLSLARAAQAFPQTLDEIEDGSRRIKQIVEDLKEFSAQDLLEQDKHVDLNLATETALRLTSNHLKKATAHVDMQLAKTLPAIKGSSQRIEQVIVNLLINACDALTDRNQKILLHTEVDTATGDVSLSISDEGRGIAAEQLPRIADPFFTTRREEGGTGLGLSVSARIVKEHQGRLEFTSTPGKGTTACITFPKLR